MNARLLLALKLPVIALTGAVTAIVWLRWWSIAMTSVGYSVLTSCWFISLTDLTHNRVQATDRFFSWFDSVYAGIGGLLVSFVLACILRVTPSIAWVAFTMAALGGASNLASSHPEMSTFMVRFPTPYVFLLLSALGFYVGSKLRVPQPVV